MRCSFQAGWRRVLVWIQVFVVLWTSPAWAQDLDSSRPLSGDRLSGVVLPVEPVAGPIRIQAIRAWTWQVDDTQRMLLEGDVKVAIGSHDFVAPTAVLWMNRIPSEAGLINQVALYFPTVDDPQKRAGLSVTGENLLVTGSARGEVTMTVTLRDNQAPPSSSVLVAAERRLADYIGRITVRPPNLNVVPAIDAPPKAELPEPVPGGNPLPPAETFVLPDSIPMPPMEAEPLIFSPEGRLGFAADSLTIDEAGDAIIAEGSMIVEYQGLDQSGKAVDLHLSAQRGVVFLKPGELTAIRENMRDLRSTQIIGIYLEGQVIATDGSYTVRANQIYYDVQRNRAAAIDAVLRTYSRELGRPVYARAKEMRQLSAREWSADKATLSISEFYTPHLSVGANYVTVTKDPEGGAGETRFDSRDNVLRAGDYPFFYWPRFSGTLDSVPLRRASAGYRDNDGVRIETEWDFFGLTGLRRPEGVDMTLKLDGFTERGPAIGTDFKYSIGPHAGEIDLYGLYDHGIDKTSAGLNVDPDEDLRGVAIAEHTSRLSRFWTLQGQLSFISDETFISAWRRDDFTQRREYETSLYLKYVRENVAFDVLGKYDINGFLSNDALLASRGYAVDKLPELTYRRYGDSLFNDAITYSSEYRGSRMALAITDGTPNELGVRSAAFGIGPDDNIADALRARGYRTDYVERFDTRHEFSLPKTMGPFEVTPYIAGRFTGYYDDEFEDYSSDSDQLRFSASGGVRVKTTIQRVYNNVESRLFDLHRLRHLLEPYVHAWYGHSTVSSDDLPIYDQDVEGAEFTEAIKFGMRNVLQTQRGGPGRWKSVDVLTLDTGAVINGNDADRRHPVPQFYDFRPEYSVFGDHLFGIGTWNFSDTLAFNGVGIWDLNEEEFARGSTGVQISHSPVFSTFLEYRFLTASENELLELGWEYLVTPKYRVSLVPSYDLKAEEFRAVSMTLRRRMPEVDLILELTYDQILDETTFSASLARSTF